MRPPLAHLALLCLGLVLPMLGCQGSGIRFGEDSIITDLFMRGQDNPAEMARDLYDPDRRYRGTVRLANELADPDPALVAIFRTNLNDREPSIRAAAARGLAIHGVAADGTLLARALDDDVAIVRRAAAVALQRIHHPPAVGRMLQLIDPLQEPEQTIRVEAALALGQYPQTPVVLGLVASLRSDNEQSLAVHRAVVRSLELLTGQNFGLDFIAWQRWIDDSRQWFADGQTYTYPVYSRSRRWFEYFPWMPMPPNETTSSPIGLTRPPR